MSLICSIYFKTPNQIFCFHNYD